MMDDDMDVDINDLFGDGADLSLPSRPLPKELFQRIDELRGSGCAQGIAWSRWGCIASISQGGSGLEFRNLRCHPLDGSWDLTEPTTIPQITPNLDGGPLQHLCWSTNGTDLAVIDSAGRISIVTILSSLSKPSLMRNGQIDPAEDLHAVVGAFWLNLYPVQHRPAVIHSLAIKTAKEYRYEVSQTVSFGPYHPNTQKSALVCLTTNGVIRFLWPQNDGKWNESTSEIESVVSSNDLITHASICADKSASLFIAFATTTKQLRTIRVVIKWGNKVGDKNVNLAQVALNPTIHVGHLAVTNWMDGSWTDRVDSLNMHSSMVALSHLQILPPPPDVSVNPPTLPTILTVRSYLPASPSDYNQDTHSIIDRWELRESSPTLHPAFEQLGSRRSNTTQPTNSLSFRKLEVFTINKVVIFVQPIALNRILCFAYSDGSFEYRDRLTLAETFNEGNLDKFIHMSQIGFSYTDEEPCLQVAVSPTGCSFVQISCDRKVKWKTLTHDIDILADPANNIQYNAIIAGLTLSCSAAIITPLIYDDLLAIAHRYTSQPSFSYDWLIELSRVLKFHFDYSEESPHDTLIRNPSIQLCLCIQNSLGYNGDLAPRSFGAKLAWISLQIRNCIVLMTMAAIMKVPDPESPQKEIAVFEDAEVIRMLSGSVRWCLDLMSWIVDSLLHPEDKSIFHSISAGQPINLKELNNRLNASGNVALHLLLSSATRCFLTVICRRLSSIDQTARRAMSTAAQSQSVTSTHLTQPIISNALRRAYTSVATLTSNSVVQIRTFETFLISISASVKDAYTTAGLPPSTSQPTQQQQHHSRPVESSRNLAEQSMLFGGAIPDEIKPALAHLFTSLLPTLCSGIDLAKLYFHDFSLLALDPASNVSDPSSLATSANTPLQNKNSAANERIAHTIDVFRRIPVTLGLEGNQGRGSIVNSAERGVVTPTRRWRRCARCTAVMEDLTSQRPAVHFLISQQRRCFCSGNWDVITGKQIVA